MRRVLAACVSSSSDQEVAEDQRIHLRALKTVQSFFGAADNRLVVVEGSVQYDRHARKLFERFDQVPVTRVGLTRYCLQSTRSVNMRRRRNLFALLGPHGVGQSHKRRGI